jgi:hypothetical protein
VIDAVDSLPDGHLDDQIGLLTSVGGVPDRRGGGLTSNGTVTLMGRAASGGLVGSVG